MTTELPITSSIYMYISRSFHWSTEVERLAVSSDQ